MTRAGIAVNKENIKTSNSNDTNPVKADDDDICELEHSRKLFIGGLSPNTTEESLKAFYEQWGKVVNVVVMRDTANNRSRGFGFITYTKAHMVDSAQDARPHIIDGKTVQAKRALSKPERDNREPNISVNKLFVGGLKNNHDQQCLTDYFSKFGNVVSVKILADKLTGKPRGFAYIEFDDYDAVDKAISQKCNSIDNVVVDVKRSVYSQENRNAPENQSTPPNNNQASPKISANKLFVGGLKNTHDEQCLTDYFSKFGNVVSVKILADKITGKRRGFSYIEFDDYDAVDKAISQKFHSISNVAVDVKRSVYSQEKRNDKMGISPDMPLMNTGSSPSNSNNWNQDSPNNSANKLFVGGLKNHHDQQTLTDYFSKFGNVVSVKILADKITGKRRGFAYIEFDDYDAVDKAILQKLHSISNVAVDVKRSVYSQEKRNVPENANKIDNSNIQGPPVPKYGQPNTAGTPMNAGPTPPNYNYWNQGSQQPQPQPNYGGNQQPPTQSPWNYPQVPPNGWNAGPAPSGPSLPVSGNWQPQSQWGVPPAGPPGPVAPPPNWNATPQVAPNGPQGENGPQLANFGTGYQQNYGGSPIKNSNMNSNRTYPYPPQGGYGNNNNPQTGPGYNNYNGPPANGPSGIGLNAQPPATAGNVQQGPNPSVPNGNRRY